MKILKYILIILLAVTAILVVVAPVGPMPGLFIGGTSTQAPTQWPDTSGIHEIKLRVPGSLPRVVIIWVIQHDGELHVVGARDSGWVEMIGQGSAVEMRLGDNTYALKATPLTQGWESVLNAYVDKYRPDYPDIVNGFPPIEEAQGSIAVFRLNRV